MPRALVVGNGKFLITFDDKLNMRDLYYPRVGEKNHIGGHKNLLGVWTEDSFSWVEDRSWQKKLGYVPNTLITDCLAFNEELGISLNINDLVHYNDCFYMKRIRVKNLVDRKREIRIFFTHDFSIDETEVGDTVAYEPVNNNIYHYKRDRYIMIDGICQGKGIYQYSTGVKRFNHAEGTWRDAEDGRLEGNTIAQGSVDSTISFSLDLEPFQEEDLYYWIAVGNTFHAVRRTCDYFVLKGPEPLFRHVGAYWRTWIQKGRRYFGDLDPQIIKLYRQSLLIVRTQIDSGGAILAANDSDILHYNRDHYSYMWPRDGALVALAMAQAGYPEVVEKFYTFCEKALTAGGYLLHKYNPDGSVGSSWHPWFKDGEFLLPIQEDETALVLYALWEHYKVDRNLEFIQPLYRNLVKPAAEFMVDYFHQDLNLPMESYDLWEERRGIYSFTASAVYGGLKAAANFARLFDDMERVERYSGVADKIKLGLEKYLYDPELGRFIRGVYLNREGQLVKDSILESSVYGLFTFGVFPPEDPRIMATMKAVEEGLWVKTKVGGVARYYNDFYLKKAQDLVTAPGNPWFICTLWLAKWHIGKANKLTDLAKAKELLTWVYENALESMLLSEQLHPYTGEPLSVSPLTWSHATYVATVDQYVEKYQRLSIELDKECSEKT